VNQISDHLLKPAKVSLEGREIFGELSAYLNSIKSILRREELNGRFDHLVEVGYCPHCMGLAVLDETLGQVSNLAQRTLHN